MGRRIHIMAIFAILAVGVATALPKPPLVYTYQGTCERVSCTWIVESAKIPNGDHLYVTSAASTAHTLSIDQTSTGKAFSTNSYAGHNFTDVTGQRWTAGLVAPYCIIKDPATTGAFFSISCLKYDATKLNPFTACDDGAKFDWTVTVVVRDPSMGVATFEQPAVAELPYVASDHVTPYYLTFRTPETLPAGGWSLVMTANIVDWVDADTVIPGKGDNKLAISATPYTSARQSQCLPTIDGLPVPVKRVGQNGLAVSINNGYVNAEGQYGGFEVQANSVYQFVYLTSYQIQGLVLTASLAPHSVSGYGDSKLVYSHGSMAAGVILSLIFGGAIGAYIVHYRNQKRVQSGFNTVDQQSYTNRINQIDA